MSLVAKVCRFKTLPSQTDKVTIVSFRDVFIQAPPTNQCTEYIDINYVFEFEVNTPISPGETLVVYFLERGRWGNPDYTGIYRLRLDTIIRDGYIAISDSLVDYYSNPIRISVEMEVRYTPPRENLSLIKSFSKMNISSSEVIQTVPSVHVHGSHQTPEYWNRPSTSKDSVPYLDSDKDDGHELAELKRNIERIQSESEKIQDTAISHIEPEDETGPNLKTGGKRIFRNSNSDEEQGLVPGPSSRLIGKTSEAYIEMELDARSPTEPARTKKIKPIVDSGGPPVLKAGDFQVYITIIEARQLAGLNMDPVVCVQIGDVRKYTSVKEGTNCPNFNEYFVFDFHMPPIMLFDKIITLSVLYSRNFLRTDKVLGSFKLDVATVWNQPDRQFYHKWAVLTDPEDVTSAPRGYLKCDISVIGKGDTIKVPSRNGKDWDDLESNLLIPAGVSAERQRARFIVKIYRADGLPKMNYSIFANVKKAFTGEIEDLVDPLVEVSYAGMAGRTSVKKNSYSPVWNEQVVFTEMFPPLCQRIKIQLKDNDPVHPSVIGTHFIDLNTISHDGERGFLPTFGPSYIYIYGSTRDYSLLDQHADLNIGMGEGVSYRARILVSIHTEIIDGFECPPSEVTVEATEPIVETSYLKNDEFFLFASIHEANMIDKKLTDKPIQFELSIGNAGNSMDGNIASVKRPHDLEGQRRADTGYWQSTTFPLKAISNDKHYYYLPYAEKKQCMHVRSIWPDHRRRLYNSNHISYIIDMFEEGLCDAQNALNEHGAGAPNATTVAAMKSVLDTVSAACSKYVTHMTSTPPLGRTNLDHERQKLCIYEIDQISNYTKCLKVIITRSSFKERLRTAFVYLCKLKQLCDDAQHAMPDIFIWMISNGKRLAYYRVNAKDIIYSERTEESGKFCGKLETVFLKWPGKKALPPSGWAIPAKLSVYLWLGILQDKKHYLEGFPKGYEISQSIKNAEMPRANPPITMLYAVKHTFQMRAYIYQARSLIGSDTSGLSDPFARVVIGESTATTQVIEETLSPAWDELLLFDDVFLYSTIEHIKANPPTIVIEIFDRDKVGKSEYIGRTLAKPHVKALGSLYKGPVSPPSLEWYEIIRGEDRAGELLATFELIEIPSNKDSSILPTLPPPKEWEETIDYTNRGPVYPVPSGIRPTLSRYRIEVLFWGLRDLKRVHFLSIDKPRVNIECSGHIVYSSVIENVKRNPNFANTVKYIDVELPDQDIYRPPLTIRVLDCRSFGRVTLVGTHTINSIHKYIYTPKTRQENVIENRKKSIMPPENVNLRSNSIFQDDVYTIENENESCPLLVHDHRVIRGYGTRLPGVVKKIMKLRDSSKKRKASADPVHDDEKSNKDWWTKYIASVEFMIEEETQNMQDYQECIQNPQPSTSLYVEDIPRQDVHSPCLDRDRHRSRRNLSPNINISPTMPKKNQIPKSTLVKIYPHELEAVPEYDGFKEWLQSFELYRGKKTGNDSDDDNRVVGVFKGAIKIYKWPFPKEIEDNTIMGFNPSQGFFQGVPNNDPIHVLVRVYIVKATELHPMDFNGKADPYIVLQLGSKVVNDKENRVSKQLNPVFGKCFEIEATFPQDSMLAIQVFDWHLLGSDEIIGETKIDLENRFYSRHRATCGLPEKYEEQGYNRWRDAIKPTQILAKLCKDAKLDSPIYEYGLVKVGKTIFNMPFYNTELFTDPDTFEEQMALVVLHRWQEFPRVGTHLVTEHVETRPIYHPSKPGVEQGRLEMWVDMFPMDMPLPGPPLDISARKPQSYEMRVIIWNTEDVVLEDDAFFTGEKMSDIYVKGWLCGPDDCQSTDIHFRSLTGEGNFNWRFIFRFDYLEAEERIVVSGKENLFSWDTSECKIPARLELQVWDSDHFTRDDFLGSFTLDLNRFPRGAKTSKLCTLDMLRTDGTVPLVDIFKQKRIKGWWPFYRKRNNEEMKLTGKVEAEIHLLTRDEAEKMPAGLGRSEPDPLDKPNRSDASFMWFLNRLKSTRYIVWHNYKRNIIKYAIIIFLTIFMLLFFYSFPEYTVKRLLGA